MNFKKNKPISGIGIALITPFDEKNNIDFKAIEKIFYSIKKYIDYIVLFGTTGESSSLNFKEKIQIIKFIENINKDKIPIILGIGGNNTNKTINNINKFNNYNFHAILSVVPYYNKPSQIGIFKHYEKISSRIDKKIIIYNVPSRTGSDINLNTILKLTKNCKNIIGIKEASNDLNKYYEIIKEKPDYFSLICGNDNLVLPIILAGGNSIISVIGQAIPKYFSTIVNNAIKKIKIYETYKLYYKIEKLIKLIFIEGNPSGIKSLLNIMNLSKNLLRLPLTTVSDKLNYKIRKTYNKIKIK